MDIFAQQCPLGFLTQSFSMVPPMGSSFFGSGVSTFDVDEDGWDDLTLGISGSGYFVFKNQQGVLENWINFYSTDDVKQCLWVDLNGDNLNDFFAITLQGNILIYQNVQNDYFLNLSNQPLQEDLNRMWMGAACGDINLDGWVDIYLCAYNESPNLLLLNTSYLTGNISFSAIQNSILTNTNKSSFQPVWLDLNGDDRNDLFVVNDFNQGNDFYQSVSVNSFVKTDLVNGLNFPVQAMSNAWSDYDLDGDLDVLITDTARTYLLQNNQGNFTPIIEDAAVEFWTWSALWMDYNNDFYDDLIITGNNVETDEGSLFQMTNSFGQMQECEMNIPFSGRFYASARWDVNNDFKYDAILAPDSSFFPLQLLNVMPANSAAKISLKGKWSNTNGIGAKYFSYSNGMRKMGQTFCGENYLSQNSQNLILPIAENYYKVDSLILHWPSGIEDKILDIQENQSVKIFEGMSLGISDTISIPICGEWAVLSSPFLRWSFNSDFGFQDALFFNEIGVFQVFSRSEFGRVKPLFIHVFPSSFQLSLTLNPLSCSDSISVDFSWNNSENISVSSANYFGPKIDLLEFEFNSPEGCAVSYPDSIFQVSFAPNQLMELDSICSGEIVYLDSIFQFPIYGYWKVNDVDQSFAEVGQNHIVYYAENGCQWDSLLYLSSFPTQGYILQSFSLDSCTQYYLDNCMGCGIVWNDSIQGDTICLSLFDGILQFEVSDQWGCISVGSESIVVENISDDSHFERILFYRYYDIQGRLLAESQYGPNQFFKEEESLFTGIIVVQAFSSFDKKFSYLWIFR